MDHPVRAADHDDSGAAHTRNACYATPGLLSGKAAWAECAGKRRPERPLSFASLTHRAAAALTLRATAFVGAAGLMAPSSLRRPRGVGRSGRRLIDAPFEQAVCGGPTP